jgi:hypothetical protein
MERTSSTESGAATTTGPLGVLAFLPSPETPELNYLQLAKKKKKKKKSLHFSRLHPQHKTIIVDNCGRTEADPSISHTGD